MIFDVPKTEMDERNITYLEDPEEEQFDYGKVIVKKPWGYEYLSFENEHVAIWILHIVRKRKTSMHCHPRKKTGLILLSGQAACRDLRGEHHLNRMDAVNIDAGAFHSTEAFSPADLNPVSENGIWVMEIESPPFKKDLCRLNDAYGRAGKSYEGSRDMVFEPQPTLTLASPEEPELLFTEKYQDLVFTVRKRRNLDDRHYPGDHGLVCVIGQDPGFESRNPCLEVGVVYNSEEFRRFTEGEDLSAVTILTIEKEEKLMKVTDYIADYLVKMGVDKVFAVCGGGAMHLVDSFGGHPELEYVAMHHEQAAAMAAEGYARISGKIGAALVTSGPGGTNAITGAYGAFIDSIPTVFVSGQVTQDTLIRDSGLRQFGVQEANIIEIVKPITKYAVAVTDPSTIRYHVEKACAEAISGRPGPVWLDIPLDVQSRIVDIENLPGYEVGDKKSDRPDYVLEGLATKALDLINRAERPVMIFGYGVRLAKAEAELLQLVEKLGLPVISSWTGSDMIPFDHQEFVGRSGIMGDRAGNFAVQNSDLVLIVGSRMSIPQVGYNYKLFARAAKKIMVDVDQVELDKPSLDLDLPIRADAGAFLKEMIALMDKDGQPRLDIEPWRDRCRSWKKRYPVALPEYKDNADKVNSFYFVDRLSDKLGPEAVVVTDMGTSFTCTMQTFRIKQGQRLFTSSGLASMGFGLPGAVGACLAAARKTILITGDGGLQMNIQEFQTVAHHKLPLIMFVLNNQGYLTIKLMQQNHFGRYIGSDPSSGLSCPDVVKLAQAYGIDALRINNQAELDERLDEILAHEGPLVVDVMMPEEQQLIPRVSSMKLPDGTIISKPMEDLYPFLDRDEFQENMLIEPVEILKK